MGARLSRVVDSPFERRFAARRGSLITTKEPLCDSSNLAIVVSNDLQNELSEYLLVVPLQRRVSRLNAPFAVDLGRADGLRDLHTARCDWLARVRQGEVATIERARFPDSLLQKLEDALRVALGFSEVIS